MVCQQTDELLPLNSLRLRCIIRWAQFINRRIEVILSFRPLVLRFLDSSHLSLSLFNLFILRSSRLNIAEVGHRLFLFERNWLLPFAVIFFQKFFCSSLLLEEYLFVAGYYIVDGDVIHLRRDRFRTCRLRQRDRRKFFGGENYDCVLVFL